MRNPVDKKIMHRRFWLIAIILFFSVKMLFDPCNVMAIQDKSLVMYLPFEEGKGNETKDISGNNNSGKINGAEWINEGKVGKALSFDGKTSYVEVDDSKSLNMADAITIEVWIYAMSHTGDYPRIVMKGYGTAYELDTKNTNSIDWEANVGGWHECNSGNDTISLKKWHHVAGTFDGKAMKIFIDGEEKVTCPFAGKLGTTNDVLQIGAYTPKNCVYFHGIIDEVAIYNRAIDVKEIRQDMMVGVIPFAVKHSGKLTTTWGSIRQIVE